MVNQDDAVMKILADENSEFRGWYEEHHSYEARLTQLAEKRALTPEEEVEEKHLKKRKLHLKDQMAEKVRHHASARSA